MADRLLPLVLATLALVGCTSGGSVAFPKPPDGGCARQVKRAHVRFCVEGAALDGRGRALPGVEVFDSFLGGAPRNEYAGVYQIGIFTSAAGYFRDGNITTPGRYRQCLRRDGYRTDCRAIRVRSRAVTQTRFVLRRLPRALRRGWLSVGLRIVGNPDWSLPLELRLLDSGGVQVKPDAPLGNLAVGDTFRLPEGRYRVEIVGGCSRSVAISPDHPRAVQVVLRGRRCFLRVR